MKYNICKSSRKSTSLKCYKTMAVSVLQNGCDSGKEWLDSDPGSWNDTIILKNGKGMYKNKRCLRNGDVRKDGKIFSGGEKTVLYRKEFKSQWHRMDRMDRMDNTWLFSIQIPLRKIRRTTGSRVGRDNRRVLSSNRRWWRMIYYYVLISPCSPPP